MIMREVEMKGYLFSMATVTLVALGIATYLIMTIAGCNRRNEGASRAVTIPPGIRPETQPSSEDILENRKRLARMAQMTNRGLKKEDVHELIDMLTPVIPSPHPEVEPLNEGYSQDMALDLLVEVGEVAHPELLCMIISNDRRKRDALVILASQGYREAIDTYVELPGLDETDLGLLEYYVPAIRGKSTEDWRRKYLKLRGELVFDRYLGRFFPRNNEGNNAGQSRSSQGK